jgi:hypothetical protein
MRSSRLSEQKQRRIEPRAETPIPGAREQTGSHRLPDDVLSEHVQRLAICTAVGAVAFWR